MMMIRPRHKSGFKSANVNAFTFSKKSLHLCKSSCSSSSLYSLSYSSTLTSVSLFSSAAELIENFKDFEMFQKYEKTLSNLIRMKCQPLKNAYIFDRWAFTLCLWLIVVLRTIMSVSVLNVIITMFAMIKSTSIGSPALLTAIRQLKSVNHSTAASRYSSSSSPSSSPFFLSLFLLSSFSTACSLKRIKINFSSNGTLFKLCLIITICLFFASYNSVNAQSQSELSSSSPSPSSPLSSSKSSSSLTPEASTTITTTTSTTTLQPEVQTTTKLNLSDNILNKNYESNLSVTGVFGPKPLISHSESVHKQPISLNPNPYTPKEFVCGSKDIRNSVEQFSKLENCTVIEGSLQIVLFDNGTVKDFENISFPNLREITDYFLIFRIMGLQSLAKLFPNLAVIRGRKLLHNYAFVVYEMLQLQEIGLINLRLIQRGDVRIEKNPNLCYVNTIDWRSIAQNALITEDKNSDACPMCPRHCPKIQNDESSSRVCWTGEHCQKLPCLDCAKKNQTCSDQGQCCSEKCIGGCYHSDPVDPSSMICVACKKFIFKDRCYNQCPEGTYEYFGRRCVTKSECIQKFSREGVQKIPYKVFENKCEPHCPVDFIENVDNPNECLFCGKACPKVCPSAIVSNIASAQSLKGCTIINGSLEISILGGGSQIVKELEENLEDLKEIVDYLKIARSFPLISLNFLKNLEYIRGRRLERSYSLLIVDNANLQELWTFDDNEFIKENENQDTVNGDNKDIEKRKRIQVENGRLFIHLNSKLCYNKINKLDGYMNVLKAKTPWDEGDVSRSSNGDKVPCEVAPLSVRIREIDSIYIVIMFENFQRKISDHRGLLGYLIYYREAPHHNVSIYDGRDACSNDDWSVIEFHDVYGTEISDEESKNSTNSESNKALDDENYVQIVSLPKEYEYILPNLKPFTRYAFYIKTYMISSESKGALSDIIYFKTKPDQPTPPRNIFSKATKHSEIMIKWDPPSKPNGEVTRYIVKATKDEVLEQARDFCTESITSSKSKKGKMAKNYEDSPNTSHRFSLNGTSSPLGLPFETESNNHSLKAYIQAGKCCTCKAEKIDPADKEQKIAFEDHIMNIAFVKRVLTPDKTEKSSISNNRNRRDTPSIELSSDLNDNNAFTTEPIWDTIEQTITPFASTNSSNNESRFIYVKQVFHQLNIVIDELEHYSEYSITVQACQNANRNGSRNPCSKTAITSVRTLPLPGADDIDQSSLSYHFDNHTNEESKLKSVFMSWKEPKNPNGYILSYHLEYQQLISEQKQGHPTIHCISRDTYEQHNGVTLELTPGNYSIRVRARSLADYGNWTESIFVVIDEPSRMSPFFWALLITVFVSLLIALIVSLFFLKQNREKLDYISVNPEYVSAGFYYEPDPAWEIERSYVKLLKELGQGSFGMVYRGELKKDNKLIPCAVKTINDNASPRERIDFLKEANIMKSFTDCYHVVKLLGIISAASPVYVLMEIMSLGDLRKYLRDNRPDNEEVENPSPPSEELLIRFSIQIADGMAYLASKKFVHRDLAARNCMINENLTVKIGDFGMARDIYETDYYRKGGKGFLPVRWMSPESLKDGLFTTFSDVWSYGIVLWEIVTLAAQPYFGLSNEEVLKFVTDGGKMTRPKDCSNVLWSLMEQTWLWKAKSRPTFLRIVDSLLDYVERDSFISVSYYWQWRTKELKAKGSSATNSKASGDTMEELIPLNRLEYSEPNEFEDHEDFDDEPVKFFPISQPVGSNMKIFEDLKNSSRPSTDDALNSESSNNNGEKAVVDNDDDEDDDDDDNDNDDDDDNDDNNDNGDEDDDDDDDGEAVVTLAKSESLSSTSMSEPGSPSFRNSEILNFAQHDDSVEMSRHVASISGDDHDDEILQNSKLILPGSFPSDASGFSQNSCVDGSQNSSPRGSTNGLSSGIINGHFINTSTSIV